MLAMKTCCMDTGIPKDAVAPESSKYILGWIVVRAHMQQLKDSIH